MRDVFHDGNLNQTQQHGSIDAVLQRARPLAASAAVVAAAALSALSAWSASAQTLAISIGVRETGTTAAVGTSGGTSGNIEWINKDGLTLNLDNTWQQFTFHFGSDPVASFTGNGVLDGTKGVLEHIRLRNMGGLTQPVSLFVDDVVNTISGTPTVLTDFEGYPADVGGDGTEVMFQEPSFSGSSNTQIQAGSTHDIVTGQPHGGTQSDKFTWQWINNITDNWMRLTTFNTTNLPNPTIDWTSGNTLSFWLRGSVAAPTNRWIGINNGNWNDPANWQSGNVPDTRDETANLLGNNTTPLTLNMDAPTVINTVNFESANKYTIAGGNALAFQGTAAGQLGNINVNLGSHEISAPVEINSTTNIFVVSNSTLTLSGGITVFGGTLIKIGPGTAVITGPQDYSIADALTVTNGTLSISKFNNGADGLRAGTLTVNSGTSPGTLLADQVRVANAAIGGTLKIKPNGTDAGVTVFNTLDITGNTDAWVGTVDLTNNHLVLDYDPSAPTSPLATVANQIKSGYAAGLWTGKGITSSAAATAASTPHKTALGYGEASTLGITTFHGQNVDGSAVVVAYTYSGDANLDSKVDTIDFNTLAANFGGTGKVWTQADFNYDGVVDTLDFNNLAANFGQQLADGSGGGAGALVPEPTSLAVLGLGAAALFARRRRSR